MIPKKMILLAGGGLILVLIFAYFIAVNENKSAAGEITVGAAPCLAKNKPLIQHIHPILKIFVDGQPEKITPDIGLSYDCEKVLHTHDDTGELHVESQDYRLYTLGNFFEVWKKSFQREGFSLKATTDGQEIADPDRIILKDKEEIILNYFLIQN